MPAIKERVPVFEGTFRIRQDVQVPTTADFSNSLGADGKAITIAGKLEYQACDSKICFLPPPFRCIGSCRSCLSIGSEHQRIFNISSVVAARAGFLRKGARDMKCVVELIHGNVLQPLKKTPRVAPRGKVGWWRDRTYTI